MASRCPQCGRPSVGVCIDCFIEKYPFGLKKRGLKACKCGKFFIRGETYTSIHDLLRERLLEDIVAPPGMTVSRVRVKSVGGEKTLTLDVEADVVYLDREFTKNLKFEIKPEFFACDVCSKQAGGYFEAILQFRVEGLKPDLDEEMLVKKIPVAGGVDYYVHSRQYARTVANDFRHKGFIVKTSSKLFGRKAGRDLYRVYYAIKGPDFAVGDLVERNGRLLKVTEIGRDVKFVELGSGKKRTIKLRMLEDVEAYARKADFRKVMVNAVSPDGMQVMDLNSFETYEVPGKEGLRQGDEADAVLFKGKMVLL